MHLKALHKIRRLDKSTLFNESRIGYVCEDLQLCQDLLGFQQGCLSAPQEVSTWTKFCEKHIQEIFNDTSSGRQVRIELLNLI